MDYHFYSPEAFEEWDWRNPETRGIGGSETSHIEMALRLARRGHRVTSYSPIPDDCPRDHGGVRWKHLAEVDETAPGVWLLYRCPAFLDKLTRADQQAWLICQDEDYGKQWTPERIARVDRVVALCSAQGHQFAERYPGLAGKVCLSSNGVKAELVEKIWAEKNERNPRRLMYASSPDRAMVPALKMFRRIREFIPDAEMHVAYGFDNIDKIVEKISKAEKQDAGSQKFLAYVHGLKKLLEQPGVVWHGRLGQEQLLREWSKTGIWLYPCSRFKETSCITSMEAQAMGAVPVVSPLWAVGENCKYGFGVEGDHEDALTFARFVQTVVGLMQNPEMQEAIRPEMMREIRRLFTWEQFADQWEAWTFGWMNGTRATSQQHAFHLRHLRGRVLNVGSNDDSGEIGRFGVNVDVMEGGDPYTGREVKVDVVADARKLPPELWGRYDTVVLSDILEHFEDEGAIEALKNARACLKPGGRILISVPEDYSDPTGRANFTPGQKYADGVYAYHWRPCTEKIVRAWVDALDGYAATFHRPIDYGFCWGHGFVVEAKAT